jgi:hypothetical protein
MEGPIEDRVLFRKLDDMLNNIAHEYITNLDEFEKLDWD